MSVAKPVVLGIAGSPRRNGNTDRMLARVAEGVEAAGGEFELIVAAQSGAVACTGCNACVSTGACRIEDGMGNVYQALDDCDALVVATPVYFATVPAVLKVLLDRFQPYWARRYRLGASVPAKRPAGVIVVGGGGDPFGSACAVTPIRSTAAVAGFDIGEVHAVVGPDRPDDIESCAGDLEAARDMGGRLVIASRGL